MKTVLGLAASVLLIACASTAQTPRGEAKTLTGTTTANPQLSQRNLAAVGVANGGVAGGGGRSKEVEGHPRMLDLVTGCTWVTGEQFIAEYAPNTNDVVQKVHQLNWYFGRSLKSEISKLQVCETEMDLKLINVTDKDSFTVFSSEEGDQIAIRDGNQVWVDMKIARRMLPAYRPALILHETMHIYLPHKTPRRNDSLRSMTASLMRPMTKDSLALNISANHLYMLLKDDDLGISEQEYLMVMSKAAPIQQRLAIARRLMKSPAREQIGMDGSDHLVSTGNLYRDIGYETSVRYMVDRVYDDYVELFKQIAAASYRSEGQRLRSLLVLAGVPVTTTFASKVSGFEPTSTTIVREDFHLSINSWHFMMSATPLRAAMMSSDVSLVKELLPQARQGLTLDDLEWAYRLADSQTGVEHSEEQFEIFKILIAEPNFLALIRQNFRDIRASSWAVINSERSKKMHLQLCMALGSSAFTCKVRNSIELKTAAPY